MQQSSSNYRPFPPSLPPFLVLKSMAQVRALVADAVSFLKPGGTLVCTYIRRGGREGGREGGKEGRREGFHVDSSGGRCRLFPEAGRHACWYAQLKGGREGDKEGGGEGGMTAKRIFHSPQTKLSPSLPPSLSSSPVHFRDLPNHLEGTDHFLPRLISIPPSLPPSLLPPSLPPFPDSALSGPHLSFRGHGPLFALQDRRKQYFYVCA